MNDLATLLQVRDILNKNCPSISTPSTSVGQKGNTYNEGFNDGQNKSLYVVMGMIKKVAKFVSVCCGVSGISKIEERAGGGRCYTVCSKCKKECEQEWRKR